MERLDKEILFNTDVLSQDLAHKTIKGGMWTLGAQGIQFISQMVGTMVLARLLTPADYGLIGMVVVVINFANIFKEAGLATATIQKKIISHEQISTLFWINVLISVTLGLCVLAGSPLVARFYGKPELTAVTAVLSISFILSGLTIQHAALLRRHMRFNSLAVIQIASQLISLTVTILLALYGWRYWALICGTMTTALATAVLTFFFCPWFPGRMQKGTGVREMLAFGGHLTGFSFLNYLSRDISQVILGKTQDIASVGNYTKAHQLFMLPLTQLRSPLYSVMVPALSRCQNDPGRYRQYYHSFIFLLAILTMPLAFLMYLFSYEIIDILLGSQWRETAHIFRAFSLYAVFYTVGATRGLVMTTSGNITRFSLWGIFYNTFMIAAIVLGAIWGAIGIAYGIVIANYILLPPSLSYCFKNTPIFPLQFARSCAWPFFTSLFSFFFTLLLVPYLSGPGGLKVLIGTVFYLMVYGLLWGVIFRFLMVAEVTELKSILIPMWRQKRHAKKYF